MTSDPIHIYDPEMKTTASPAAVEPLRPVCPAAFHRSNAQRVPGVEVAVNQTSDELVIRVKGEARVECAGALLGELLASTARRPAMVTLDLSELQSISGLGLGVLAAYRRSVVRTGGRVRLAKKLQPAVKGALGRADLFDLLEAIVDEGPAPNRQAAPARPRVKVIS
jgi:anti-anti-sigma factor